MLSGQQLRDTCMNYTHAAARRRRDPILSALLVAQFILIFIAEPLAFRNSPYPLIVIGLITAGLVLAMVLGSHQRGAQIVIVIGGLRLLTGGADLLWHTSLTARVETISAVLSLLVLIWVVFKIVFGPGQVTSHRVRGAIGLYLTVAISLRLALHVDIADGPWRVLWSYIPVDAWCVEPVSLL